MLEQIQLVWLSLRSCLSICLKKGVIELSECHEVKVVEYVKSYCRNKTHRMILKPEMAVFCDVYKNKRFGKVILCVCRKCLVRLF